MADQSAKLWNISILFTQKGQQLLARVDPDGEVFDIPGVSDRRKIEQREKDREKERFAATLEHRRQEQLKEFNQRLDRMREEAVAERHQIDRRIAAAERVAPKVDGKPVFRTEDGGAVFRDGTRVSDEKAANLDWTTPQSHSDYLTEKQLRGEDKRRREVEQRIDTFDRIKERANDRDTSLEELKQMKAEVVRIKAEAAADKEPTASSSQLSRSGLTGPDLNGSFITARDNAATPKIAPHTTPPVPLPTSEL